MRARTDDVFFSAMVLLILGSVLLGFWRSYYFAGVFHAPLPNPLVHVHAAVFSAWILLLIVQTSLVSAGRLDLHRRLGILGAALAGAMVVLAFLVATDSLARGFAPPGSTFDPKSFYSIPLFETAVFCVLIVWALRARADGPAHKRLILIASISLMGPAIGRWPFVPIAHTGLWISAILDFFILLVVAFDLWSRRRIHRATVQGGLFMIIVHQAMIPIGLTPVWHRFATFVNNVWTSFR
ncbi:MAG: hypothetical protein ABSF12_04025 [Bryobacteraceae bacterium]